MRIVSMFSFQDARVGRIARVRVLLLVAVRMSPTFDTLFAEPDFGGVCLRSLRRLSFRAAVASSTFLVRHGHSVLG